MRRVAPTGLLLAFLSACAAPPPEVAELPGWAGDRHAAAIPPFLEGCRAVARLPADRPLGGTGATALHPAALSEACAEAAALPPGDDGAARLFLERRFRPHAMGEGLMTGYFEPELAGSPVPTPALRTPLLARPPELVEVDLGLFDSTLTGRRVAGQVRDGRLRPFADRAAIMGGALAGRGLELVWVDPVDAFFLQIQGSGRIALPGQAPLRLGYAGQNGRPYVPVGRVLVERGILPREAVSMQSIRGWMDAAGPDAAAELMARNPSYVFFAPREGLRPDQGPPGTLGAPLTPGRSLAVDRAHVPLGIPVWVTTRDPVDGTPIRRLLMAQDTGGAIRGEARGDLFFGWGAEAAERAGRMREPATLHLLLPR
ncbi:MAG TPA: MltA domain-containing protein [Acetobacteraceae bacterium]|nr:MltA domain-containing protein [Acetobacteraceae bacterium]